MKEIYSFGSICRGEIDEFSDVDTLLITDEKIATAENSNISVYTPQRISQLWEAGDPFAWHLYYEARLIYSSQSAPFLRSLQKPQKYKTGPYDVDAYEVTYNDAMFSLKSSNLSPVFDAGAVFVGMRNAAISYSLIALSTPVFSRDAAILIDEMSIAIPKDTFTTMKISRLAAVRGIAYKLTSDQIKNICNESDRIEIWFSRIKEAIK